MSDYTLMNLRDATDIAPGAGLDSVEETRFPAKDLGAQATGFALHSLKPNQRGVVHRHNEAEEVYLVLDGSGRASLDGTIVDLERLDALRVAPAVVRAFESGPGGMELFVFGRSQPGDGELISDVDPWAEAA